MSYNIDDFAALAGYPKKQTDKALDRMLSDMFGGPGVAADPQTPEQRAAFEAEVIGSESRQAGDRFHSDEMHRQNRDRSNGDRL